MSFLQAKNIHKVYHNGKKALNVLKGVDLSIEKGEFTAIIGPSGAGKSTLLHILGGLDVPSQGEVILEEEDIYKLGDIAISRIRNKKIGFVFQFYHLLSEFTVLENVSLPALINRPAPAASGGRPSGAPCLSCEKDYPLQGYALKLLKQAGLEERVTHFPSELSGGEKQRAAIVRGLINSPSLLLCDEPTGNLDSKTGDGIISLIKKINMESRMTVIFVTHNLELTKAADRIYHLKDGILVG